MVARAFKSPMFRGVLKILAGLVSSQAISFLASPVISRLYPPAEYGIYATIAAVVAVVVPFANLRFDFAVLLPDTDGEVSAVARAALISSALISVGAGGAVYFMQGAGSFDEVGSALLLWVPVLVFLGSLFVLLSQLCLRLRLYGLIGRRNLGRSVVQNGSQVGIGLTGLGANGLLLGSLFGQLAGLASMFGSVRRYLQPVPFREVWQSVREYWRFPVVFAPAALMNSFALQMPLLFFTGHFGVALSGQLAMAERVVAAPVTLLMRAVGQTVNAEFSQRLRDGTGGLARTYLKLTLFLTGIATAIAVTGGLFGGTVVPWLLGEKWRFAGILVEVLAVTAAARAVAAPLSGVSVLAQKSMANTVLEVVRLVMQGLAALLVIWRGLSATEAAWAIYGAQMVSFVFVWLYGLYVVAQMDKGTVNLEE